MSAFAVAAFHEARLAVGAASLDAVVWIRATAIEEPGVDVSLRVWTPRGAHVAALRELAPGDGDLLAGAAMIDERTLELEAGRWLAGVREYELAMTLPACDPGDELLAARVNVVVGGVVAGGAQIAVTWCDAGVEAAPRGTSADVADLPTDPSLRRAHVVESAADGEPCPGCGAPRDQDDAYCERCGRALTG